MSEWKQTAVELLQAITPEFREVPVYVIDPDELASFDERFAGVCPKANGWTGVLCDHLCSEYLRADGSWQGAGFAAVIRGDREPLDCIATVLHEASHYLDWHGQQVFQVVRAEHVAKPLHDLHHQVAAANAVCKVRLAPWYLHERRFVRAACHVANRAGELLAAIRPKHVAFATDYYGQPFTEQAFSDALSTELRQCRPVTEILASEPCDAFRERYKQATDWWSDGDVE